MVGTAGWGIAARYAGDFPGEGTHLERYAVRLSCVEINSSFYRSHRPEAYARWADAVPEGFRFSVKLPKTITHEKRLRDCDEEIARFLAQAGCLGAKFGMILVQTPPSLAFSQDRVASLLGRLQSGIDAGIAVEPRHRSWFSDAADTLMQRMGVARVAADPALFPDAGEPGGSAAFAYFRFHGSPVIYQSDYPPEALDHIRRRLDLARKTGVREVWCIFDNTAEGYALGNALAVAEVPSGKPC